jgi:hypothetical protein
MGREFNSLNERLWNDCIWRKAVNWLEVFDRQHLRSADLATVASSVAAD